VNHFPKETIFSKDRSHRYTLWRDWSDLLFSSSSNDFVQFILLNPSTADENLDDPTIRRCIQFAKDWGYQSLCVTNLFSFRSTNPSALRNVTSPSGDPENFASIFCVARQASRIVCAWGNHGNYLDRAAYIHTSLTNSGHQLHCFKLNSDGSPSHPLYLPKSIQIIPFLKP
jgi:hypothetical protein